LIPKLKAECKAEEAMFDGSRRREFFIEVMDAPDADGLMAMFDPSEHNSLWDAARQKNPVKLDNTMNNRKAIDFMVSGRKGVHRRYVETELSARIAGRHRMFADDYMLDRSKEFTTMVRKK
jgi:hypothetical protein